MKEYRCLICNKIINKNDYVVVVSKKEKQFICANCAIDNWHYYQIEDSGWGGEPCWYDEDEYEEDVWEQQYGPDVLPYMTCSTCHEQIRDEDEAILDNRTEKYYHIYCLEWPKNYHGCGVYYDNFSAFADCQNNAKEIKELKEQGFVEPYKLKDVIN